MKPCESKKSQVADEETSRAIRRAQEIVRRYVPPGRSLVDELIRERREEAQREERSGH